MVAAGGRPNVTMESAVARCQLRYHALFLTASLPLLHAKQTNTLALSRMPSTEKESNTSVFLDHELDCCARGI